MNRIPHVWICALIAAGLSGCATDPGRVSGGDSPWSRSEPKGESKGSAPATPTASDATLRESQGALTLADALALTIARSPELATYSYDIRIAEAEILQASLRPNPEAQVQSENVGGSGAYSGIRNAEHTLQIGQLIELAGKRRKRIDEARYGRSVVAFEYEVRKREVFLSAHAAFIAVLAGQRTVEVDEELVSLAEKGLPDIQRRIEAGKTSSLEAQRANVAVANTQIALEQARRDLLTARHRLAAQWGSTQPMFSSVEGNLEEMGNIETFEILSSRLVGNPRLARFAAERDQREARLRLEKARAVPDVTVFGGLREFGKADAAALVVGASIPLPLFNKNQGAIQAARERVSRTEVERVAVETELSAELAGAYHAAQGALSQIRLFRETVLPQSEQALTTAREGYNAGRFSFLDVLDAQRTLIAARQQYIQALAIYQQSAARASSLTTAVGGLPKIPSMR